MFYFRILHIFLNNKNEPFDDIQIFIYSDKLSKMNLIILSVYVDTTSIKLKAL